MKRLGLVETSGSSDRRQRPIHLTAKGADVAQRLSALWEATARAASRLESELPCGLVAPVDDALAALEGLSFAQRIRKELSR
jgi:DNA-binding MarR family transcriptional regulator